MAVNPQDSVAEAITKELLSNQIRHYTRAGCTTEWIREMLVIEHEPLGQYDPDMNAQDTLWLLANDFAMGAESINQSKVAELTELTAGSSAVSALQ